MPWEWALGRKQEGMQEEAHYPGRQDETSLRVFLQSHRFNCWGPPDPQLSMPPWGRVVCTQPFSLASSHLAGCVSPGTKGEGWLGSGTESLCPFSGRDGELQRGVRVPPPAALEGAVRHVPCPAQPDDHLPV